MSRHRGVSLSRRDFIGTGLVAGIGTALAGPPAARRAGGLLAPAHHEGHTAERRAACRDRYRYRHLWRVGAG